MKGWMIEQFSQTLYLNHYRNGKHVREEVVYPITVDNQRAKRIRQFAQQAIKDGASVELTFVGWAVRWGKLPKGAPA